MRSIERLLIDLEDQPWGMLYRAVLGFVTFALFESLRGPSWSEWWLLPGVLAVFLALRVIPAVLRRALPFSQSACQVWSQRRRLAKLYDSYQWQKVLGFAIGLTFYMAITEKWSSARLLVLGLFLAGGLIGALRWGRLARRIGPEQIP